MATATLKEVDTGDVPHMVAKLRKGFKSGKTRDKNYQIQQLKNLFRILEEKEDKKAGYNDLRKACCDNWDCHSYSLLNCEAFPGSGVAS